MFFKQVPIPKAIIDELGKEIVDYAQSKGTYFSITKFCRLKNIDPAVLLKWRKKWPELDEQVVKAKEFMGDRLFENAAKRKLDGSVIKPAMGMFSQEWREYEEWKRRKDDERVINFKIVVPKNEEVIDREALKKLETEETEDE